MKRIRIIRVTKNLTDRAYRIGPMQRHRLAIRFAPYVDLRNTLKSATLTGMKRTIVGTIDSGHVGGAMSWRRMQ